MAGPAPTTAFSRVVLDLVTVDAGEIFGRIHRKAFPDPVGYGKNATRFSDPRRRKPDNRFGVLYLGATLKVCFLETIVRDQRDGVVGDVGIEERELTDRYYSELQVRNALRLINLDDDGAVRMGIPTDVLRGRGQALARKWSLAIYDHPAAVDGILYPSRLNNQTNIALYDRAVGKIVPRITHDLDHAPGIAAVLNDFFVALT